MNTLKNLGVLTTCVGIDDINWEDVPEGFDWFVVSALRVVVCNNDPLMYDEEYQQMVPKQRHHLPEDHRMLDLGASPLGLMVDNLVARGHMEKQFGNGLVSPLLVYQRPANKPSKVKLLPTDNGGETIVRADVDLDALKIPEDVPILFN